MAYLSRRPISVVHIDVKTLFLLYIGLDVAVFGKLVWHSSSKLLKLLNEISWLIVAKDSHCHDAYVEYIWRPLSFNNTISWFALLLVVDQSEELSYLKPGKSQLTPQSLFGLNGNRGTTDLKDIYFGLRNEKHSFV